MIKQTIWNIAILGCAFITSCEAPKEAPVKLTHAPKHTHQNDVHTYAKMEKARVTHLNWDAEVDFKNSIISATATWDIQTDSVSDTIIFDSYDLKILSVLQDGAKTPYREGRKQPHMGTPIHVKITPTTKQVSIIYESSPSAGAVLWLNKEQTHGKKHPFMFTQSEAILARTWIPCQDSPEIKFTYNAKVKVPPTLMAVMSAVNPVNKNDTGVYTFEMNQPIPSYLMALAVGDLTFQEVGKRTGVYAEPSQIEAAAYEFAETENMVEIAEELFGTYAWERYDMLVLPPSFPFGGMENPRLSFITPTIIAGDRSLTSLIAHELAHSWSGNLVTNASWNDFWLNEGFTVYLERRIMDSLYGESYADMLSILGAQDLKHSLSDLPENDTRLKLNLKGRNPDDGMTDIAYEKGFHFLTLLSQTYGQKEMDEFLKGYFEYFKFNNLNTEEFITYLDSHLIIQDTNARKRLQIEEWIYEPGLPSNCPKFTSTRFQNVSSTLKVWADGAFTTNEIETGNWSTNEWLHFLRLLPDTLSNAQFYELDTAFHFTTSGNNEILAIWLEKCINGNYTAVDQKVSSFLHTVGRRKFLTPIYKALLRQDTSGKKALLIYTTARQNYHAVAIETLDELLKYHK